VGDSASRVVSVEIHGQRYPVRSGLDVGYVTELATYVDEKMRSAADQTPAADSLKVAVLAALNIADEYFQYRNAGRPDTSAIHKRATEIEQVVDQALAQFQ
jgi:cell division protein ZapA